MRQQWTICGYEVTVESAVHEGRVVFDWSVRGEDYSTGGMAETYDEALGACLAELVLLTKVRE